METAKRDALINNRNVIIGALDAFDVSDDLYSSDILLPSEYSLLLDDKLTPQARTAMLLDFILKRNTNEAYYVFLDFLKANYSSLFSVIRSTEFSPTAGVQHVVDCHETLVLGNFPKLPPFYIERSSKLAEIRAALAVLKSQETLVLHGMLLIGKSCLAVAALQDVELLKTAFNGKVFWVNLAEIHNEKEDKDKILLELHRLLLSTGANFNNEIVTDSIDDDLKVQELQAALKKVLVTPHFKHALFVLDKLRCPNIVKYFDVGCKLMITTCDLNFIPRSNGRCVIKLTDGFTERETRELFQKCLDAEPDQLPHEVKLIRSLCKGHPMIISLIASYLEESKEWALKHDFLWSDVVEKLLSPSRLPEAMDIENKLSMALDLCVDKLSRDLQKFYVDLAIFAEDVNIPSKVLETLWDLNRSTVRQIMTQLEKKALVMSFFNSDLKIYVYMIHNLFLVKLRHMLSREREITLHRKLIERCETVVSNWDLEEMEADDYVLQYFGYHLQKAGMLDKFSVYFNLKFIAAKIKVVGCADLLRDFQLYRSYITKCEPVLEKKLEEYEKFVSEYGGVLHKYKQTDIVQCALQLSSSSCIYNDAVEIAKQNPNRLYFNIQLSPDRHYFTHILELEYDVTAACFTSNTDHILVGTTNGDIIMWEQHYKREICKFRKHRGKIRTLMLNPEKTDFLSVSEDGTVKLWSLRGLTPRNSSGAGDQKNGNIPSPFLRQNRYYDTMQNDQCIDRCTELASEDADDQLVSAAFSNNYGQSRKVATGSRRGKIKIYNMDEMKVVLEIPSSGSPASCLAFSFDDNLIIFTREWNILIYSTNDGSYLSQLCNQDRIDHLLVVPKIEDETHKIITVNQKVIITYHWKTDMMLRVTPPERKETVITDDYSFTCAAVMKDGRYLVTGSTDSYLRTWDITANSKESSIEKFNDGKVVCLDTFLKDKNDSQVHILLVISANKTAKQWYVHSDVHDSVPVKNLPVFATFWKKSSSTPLVAVVNITYNKIQILNGYKLITETEVIPCNVKMICFSLSGNEIKYGLENGNIYEFCYKTRRSALMITLSAPINYLKCFEDTSDLNSGGVLAAASTNGDFVVLKGDKVVFSKLVSEYSGLTIVFCVFVKAFRSFLVVSKKRNIIIWDLNSETEKLLVSRKSHLNVVSCALSSSGTRFVCVFTNGTFEMYRMLFSPQIDVELEQEKTLSNGGLQCCCFSFDEKFIAFGKENGDIVIWDIERKATIASLELHHTAIKHLAFSPEPDYVLVSLSEQIAWWNLSKVLPKTPQKILKGKPLLKNLILHQPEVMTDLSIWNNKETRRDNLFLLSTVKLQGNYANYVSVSPTFSAFVTVDNNGKIYIIEVFDNVH